MNDVWKEYEGDFNSLSDEEIEQEVVAEQTKLDEAESWLEAVASWKAAGSPRARLPGSMFKVGETYKTVSGQEVTIAGIVHKGLEHECVYTVNEHGPRIHRYNRRDFGRVTGTDHNNPDPDNLVEIPMRPVS